MFQELSAKDVNKLSLLNQDGTCQLANMNVDIAAVKIAGILDMYAPTAVLQFITDKLIAIALDKFAFVDVFLVILMKLENSQDHADTFKLQKV